MGTAGAFGKPVCLEVHDRWGAERRPLGVAVACPRRGWVPVTRCIVCRDFGSISTDPATSRAFLTCTPATLTVDERAGEEPVGLTTEIARRA